MAVLTETDVRVICRIRRGAAGDARLDVMAISINGDGEKIREGSFDPTDQLTAAQKTTLENILASAESRARTRFGIG